MKSRISAVLHTELGRREQRERLVGRRFGGDLVGGVEQFGDRRDRLDVELLGRAVQIERRYRHPLRRHRYLDGAGWAIADEHRDHPSPLGASFNKEALELVVGGPRRRHDDRGSPGLAEAAEQLPA